MSTLGACLEHPERTGIPCTRCGTFRCSECLTEGRCPPCRGSMGIRSPQPDETVGFGRRAWGRIIDFFFGQASGLGGGVLAGVVLVILEASGVVRTGWAARLDHGFLFNFLTGSAAVVVGMALSTSVCGASAGKVLLGMRVIRMNGEPPGFFDGMVRELGYFIDSFFFGLVAKGQMDGSPHRQRLGDQWAKTTVVKADTLPAGTAAPMGRVVLGIALGLTLQALVLTVFIVVAAL